MATSETSGKSKPSRNKLIPINTSYSPVLNSRSNSTLRRVSTSECKYLTLTPRPNM